MNQGEWKVGDVKYLYLNGEIIPYEKAVIHIFTPAYRYGAMVFEGIRGYWNEEANDMFLFRVPEHCERLNESLKLSRMSIKIDPEEMANNLVALVRKNNVRQTVHFIYSAYVGGDGPMLSKDPIGTAITIRKTGHMYDIRNGIKCSVSNWRRNPDEASPMRIKAAANYQNSRLALLQAKQDGYDSTILLNHHGEVSEGPSACVFVVRGGRLMTPSVTSDILESITRNTVIRLYNENFLDNVLERSINRTELYIAEEVFFCGTGAEIVPIVNIDGFTVGDGTPGKVTRQLIQRYRDVVTGRSSEHAGWRIPVYKV